MREIPISKGLVALVDDEDYDRVFSVSPWSAKATKHLIYAVKMIPHPSGEWVIYDNGKRRRRRVQMHMHTYITGFSRTDHKDHNGLNNQKENLREVTQAQNRYNSRVRSDNTSGFKGVSWSKSALLWRAYIMKEGKNKSLGFYPTPQEAAIAYDQAARLQFGEYASCNFPES